MNFEIYRQLMQGNPDAVINSQFTHAFFGSFLGALVAIGILALLVVIFALYVYHSLAWMTIARKLKYKHSWLAWIPFASTAMRLQLGGFHWAWTFLFAPLIIGIPLIPILIGIPLVLIGILCLIALFVLLIISYWRIFEKRKYPGWFSLSMIIPKLGAILYLVIIGFVAWDDRKKMLFK